MKSGTDIRGVARALARRSLDIAADSATSLAEGADHLVRLAKHQRVPLHLALAELRRGGSTSATCKQANTLLQLAIAQAALVSNSFDTRNRLAYRSARGTLVGSRPCD